MLAVGAYISKIQTYLNDLKKLTQLFYLHSQTPFQKLWLPFILALLFAGVKGGQAYFVKPLFEKGLTPDTTVNQLLSLTLGLILLSALSLILRFAHHTLVKNYLLEVMDGLRLKLMDQLFAVDWHLWALSKPGSYLHAMMEEVKVIQTGLMSAIEAIRDPITATVLYGYLLWLNPLLTCLISIILPLILWVYFYIGNKVKRYSEKGQMALADYTQELSQIYLGIQEIKIYGLEKMVSQHTSKIHQNVTHAQKKLIEAEEFASPLVDFLGAICLCVVLYFTYTSYHHPTPSAVLASYLVTLLLLMDPLRKLSRHLVKINQALVSLNRLEQLFHSNPSVSIQAIGAPTGAPEIKLKDVGFSFDVLLFQGISKTIKQGTWLGLLGKSGSGKSTFIQLLCGLRQPTSGTIEINGEVAWVEQMPYLFYATIKENIILNQPFDGALFNWCIESAQLTSLIENHPQKWDRMIGENNALISGGEAQRIAIARALYSKRCILILDEATSALNQELEQLIFKTLKSASFPFHSHPPIIIASTHRQSNYAFFDQVIVFGDNHS